MHPAEATVRLLDADAAEETATVERLAAIVNVAFEQSEGSLFPPGRQRIAASELIELIRAGQLAVAQLGDELAGCVRVTQLNATVGQWGLLAVPPERQGHGIARRLVRFAEDQILSRGCTEIEIQLLTPHDPELLTASKALSESWYRRIGYEPHEVLDFAALHPEAAAVLTGACDFRSMRKQRRPSL